MNAHRPRTARSVRADGDTKTRKSRRTLALPALAVLSDYGMHADEIAQLVGHTGGSGVTERIYRKQLKPVIQTGAVAMDTLFGEEFLRGGEDG